MLLLGLQATVNKCNLLISQKRACHAGLLTQDCSSWAEDAILINHSTYEKLLLLLITFPLLPPQVFLYIMSQITVTHRKGLIQGSPALIYPFSPPHKTPSRNSSPLPLLKVQWSPASIFSTGALLVPRTLEAVQVSLHAIRHQIWTLQCFLEHPELSSESQTNTLIAFNLSASNHSV